VIFIVEGKKSRTPGEKCQAVSEVYGQILMVVVTILLAALLVYPNIPESAPRANLLIEAHNFTQNETTSTQNEETPTQDETTPAGYLIEASSGSGGNISPEGSISVTAGGNKIFSMMPDENYKVLDVLVDGNSAGPISTYTFNNVSSSHSIKANFTVDFAVENNNTVIPKGNFTVNATVLGCAFTGDIWKNDYWVEGYWKGYGDNRHWVKGHWEGHWKTGSLPITCRLKLGDKICAPWGDYTNVSDGNINDGISRFWGSNNTSFEGGTSVTVEACSWKYDTDHELKKHLIVNTSTLPLNVKVLTNGDPVPDISGFQGQDSVEDFVKGYIENGSIKLKENEAIYIFELGNTDLDSSGADFQDLVILVSVNGADASKSAIESHKADLSKTSNNTPNEASGGTSNETSSGAVLKFVIEHRGGDTINFKSPEETKVILQKGDDQRYLNFTELGAFKSGDRATLIPKEYGANEQLNFSQGDCLSIKIVDVRSKSLIYSGSIMIK
jgi:FlaG/FlaF family flagellin (archaellin)